MAAQTTIIIGSSAAGIACASKLRSLDATMNIICLSADSDLPYNRCLLADYLSNAKTPTDLALRTPDFFNENNIDLRLNCQVTHINRTARTVTMQNGQVMPYTNLVIATGKSAYIPNPDWLKLPGVFSLYDQRDVTAIHTYIATKKPRTALVVGAGFTGVEAADSLTKLGITVTLLERSEHILPQQIDREGALFLTNILTNKAGITTITSDTINTITTAATSLSVTTREQRIIDTDLMIVATGSSLNIQLARNADIACDSYGIVTNQYMQTSDPYIYAAGDCCSVINILTKQRINSCLWADAVQQGMIVAHTICGISKEYPGALIITSSTIAGTTFVTSGDIAGAEAYASRYRRDQECYHRIFMHDEYIKGFVMVGNIMSVGQLRKALLTTANNTPA